MECDNETHKHSTEKEMALMIETVIKQHVQALRTAQEILYNAKICEHDFFAVLTSVAVHVAGEAILHIAQSSRLSKQEAIDMIMGGIAQHVGADFIAIKTLSQVPRGTLDSSTTH